jgi:hypothetical protein
MPVNKKPSMNDLPFSLAYCWIVGELMHGWWMNLMVKTYALVTRDIVLCYVPRRERYYLL